MANDRIVLGSGKLYVLTAGTEIPEDSVIEVEDNLIGYIQGGATLSYSPDFYEAKDDLGYVAKKMITDEEVTLKSGVMTWNGDTLKKLCATGRVEDTETERVVKIGGTANYKGTKYLIRFVHEDSEEGNIRITLVGSNENGFELAFAKDKETVINAEFKALPMDTEGTLVEYREDI